MARVIYKVILILEFSMEFRLYEAYNLTLIQPVGADTCRVRVRQAQVESIRTNQFLEFK
jgi:hypothetical protein